MTSSYTNGSSDLSGQLERYATDLRDSFAAEKDKARRLSEALDELSNTYLATVRGFASAVDAKDAYTAGHLIRVSKFGLLILEVLSPESVGDPQYEYGFLLHDIGKLAVPDAILGKPGPLDDLEWQVMKRHPAAGRQILQNIPFLSAAVDIVYSHHERCDGKGYPQGLTHDEIPFGARVFSVADTLDAMTSSRPYRKGRPLEVALEEVCNGSGSQFCSEVVEALMTIDRQLLQGVVEDLETSSGFGARGPELVWRSEGAGSEAQC